jgi:hypothetical protein
MVHCFRPFDAKHADHHILSLKAFLKPEPEKKKLIRPQLLVHGEFKASLHFTDLFFFFFFFFFKSINVRLRAYCPM